MPQIKITQGEKEQCIVNSLHDEALQEDAKKILKWFMQHEVTLSPIPNINLSSELTQPQNEILRSLTKNNQDISKGKNEILAVKPQKTGINPKPRTI